MDETKRLILKKMWKLSAVLSQKAVGQNFFKLDFGKSHFQIKNWNKKQNPIEVELGS